jgi:hypothetical protein
VERLLKEKEDVGLVSGFVFVKKDGSSARAVDFEEALVERLEWIQQNTVGIIHLTILLVGRIWDAKINAVWSDNGCAKRRY